MMSSSRRPAASGASASTSVTSPAQAATKACTPHARVLAHAFKHMAGEVQAGRGLLL